MEFSEFAKNFNMMLAIYIIGAVCMCLVFKGTHWLMEKLHK